MDGFSLGSGTRFFTVETIAQQMGLGLTPDGVVALCHSLNVPILLLPSARVVNLEYLRIALVAISRIGARDFAAPGAPPHPAHAAPATSLDAASTQANMELFIAELLYMRRNAGFRTPASIAPVAREVANRLVQAAVHLRPLAAQAASDSAALALLHRENPLAASHSSAA